MLSTHVARQVPPAGGEPGLVLARGMPIDSSFLTAYAATQWVGVGIIIILDALTVFLATWLFLVSGSTMSACSTQRGSK